MKQVCGIAIKTDQNFLLNKDLCMKFSAKSQQCFFSKCARFH